MNTYENKRARLVEDFINTYDLFLEQPEHLLEPADLERFFKAHGLGLNGGETFTHTELEQARDLRAQLRACWTAESVEEMTAQLNPLLAQSLVIVQVAPADSNLSIQFELPTDASPLQRLSVECARGIIAVAQQYDLERMRSCAAEPCRDVFVDTSRNKSRRFCSERCANRYNVAAFRDRQKNGD